MDLGKYQTGLCNNREIPSATLRTAICNNWYFYYTRNTRHGISCEGKRARQVTKADYAEYDYLIGMDSANIRNMLRIFGGDPDGKVARLLSYAGSERDISDPWYTGEFGTTYNDVLEGCTAFIQYLQQNGRIDT